MPHHIGLTLDVYGDNLAEEDGGAANILPGPPGPAKPAEVLGGNVVSLFGRHAS
jgi:hypothetical protein